MQKSKNVIFLALAFSSLISAPETIDRNQVSTDEIQTGVQDPLEYSFSCYGTLIKIEIPANQNSTIFPLILPYNTEHLFEITREQLQNLIKDEQNPKNQKENIVPSSLQIRNLDQGREELGDKIARAGGRYHRSCTYFYPNNNFAKIHWLFELPTEDFLEIELCYKGCTNFAVNLPNSNEKAWFSLKEEDLIKILQGETVRVYAYGQEKYSPYSIVFAQGSVILINDTFHLLLNELKHLAKKSGVLDLTDSSKPFLTEVNKLIKWLNEKNTYQRLKDYLIEKVNNSDDDFVKDCLELKTIFLLYLLLQRFQDSDLFKYCELLLFTGRRSNKRKEMLYRLVDQIKKAGIEFVQDWKYFEEKYDQYRENRIREINDQHGMLIKSYGKLSADAIKQRKLSALDKSLRGLTENKLPLEYIFSF